MLKNKQFYISLVRERTNETVVLELTSALTIIKKYDEKLRFMNMLGQETFWKKNRLDLWSALLEHNIDNDVFLAIPADDRIYISRVPFKHTNHMLNDIKIELVSIVNKLIDARREFGTTTWRADHTNNIYSNGERHYVTRAVRADIPYFYIRTEDVPAFDRDLNKLLDKYKVRDPLRLKNGAQRYRVSSVSNRYVERYFNFPRIKEHTYW